MTSAKGDVKTIGTETMLKRGSKNSYNPYSTGQRVKREEAEAKNKLDKHPNRPTVWLKQVCQTLPTDSGSHLAFIHVPHEKELVIILIALRRSVLQILIYRL